MSRVFVVICVKIHDAEPELSVRAVSCQGGWLAKQVAYLRPPQRDVSCSPHVSCSQV